jgi:CheY-like chemotaxis protein
MRGDREQCLEAGMDDYICKPVRLDELMQLLEKWARGKRKAV